MSFEFKLPELGENITKATLVGVLVSVGDQITAGQPVLELETDKAVLEVPSDVGGQVTAVHVKAGDEVAVGQVLLTLEPAEAAPAPAQAAPAAPVSQAAPPAAPAAPAPAAPPAAPAAPPAAEPVKSGETAPAAPSVRRFARELGVEIAEVAGSGPAGRVTTEDVKTHVRTGMGRQAAAPAVAAPLPDFSKWGPVQREKMSNVRRATARNLGQSWPAVPMVTQFDKADITELEQLRAQFGKRAEAAGGKLTPTALILKVVAGALKRFPQFNASIDLANEEIVFKQYIHVGVAVDTDRGLLVPVLRDVDQKNTIQLAVELGQIAQRARERKLSMDEMQGGCFTISNLGGIGGTGFTPLVNAPEVAILGVSRGSVEPVWVDGQWQPRQMLPLSLTYDHRLIDGADGARFLRWVCEALEQPFLLMLEG
ncbi:MAG TPA: 2-oxo acid dehydrogenase subunit E2 [Anaerolineae bacterium]|nr:2-oxo acid dehydrogenase subunit E2 [Anaerolineae bacterium]HNU03396.1 2-oxo acid dehydrogenase subunit E2 [Anaerolineae bacterium]